MVILEVRRHAERSLTVGGASALTAAGRAAATALGKAGGPFALVVSSPLPRAKETATLIGGRLDAADPALLPDVGGAGIFGDTGTLDGWERVLQRPDARAFGDEQVAAWAALARRVRDGERVLAISHSGLVELPAALIAHTLTVKLAGPAFGFLEGVRVSFEQGTPAAIEVVRVRV